MYQYKETYQIHVDVAPEQSFALATSKWVITDRERTFAGSLVGFWADFDVGAVTVVFGSRHCSFSFLLCSLSIYELNR
jgi:hypothetical protein